MNRDDQAQMLPNHLRTVVGPWAEPVPAAGHARTRPFPA